MHYAQGTVSNDEDIVHLPRNDERVTYYEGWASTLNDDDGFLLVVC